MTSFVYHLESVAVLAGHDERAWCVAWNPKKPLLASCSSDKTVRLYNYDNKSNFKLAHSIPTGHSKTVRCVAWSPSGEKLATASFDESIAIWEQERPDDEDAVNADADGGGWECVDTLDEQETECKCVAYSPTGMFLASCSRDKTVWIREVQPDNEHECVGVVMSHTQDVKCVAWHPTEEILASASYDDTIKLYEDDSSDDWYDFTTLTGHEATVWSLAFSPDGNYLASSSDDLTIRIWKRVEKYRWKETFVIKNGHERSIYSISWGKSKSEEGSLGWLASAGGDGKINVWDILTTEDGTLISRLLVSISDGHGVSDINCITWCPREGYEDLLATAGDDCTARVWRISKS